MGRPDRERFSAHPLSKAKQSKRERERERKPVLREDLGYIGAFCGVVELAPVPMHIGPQEYRPDSNLAGCGAVRREGRRVLYHPKKKRERERDIYIYTWGLWKRRWKPQYYLYFTLKWVTFAQWYGLVAIKVRPCELQIASFKTLSLNILSGFRVHGLGGFRD